MRTNLKGFVKNFGNKRDWGGLWSIDGRELNDRQARIFVNKAIEAGYECDVDVPEDLIREWLGISKK